MTGIKLVLIFTGVITITGCGMQKDSVPREVVPLNQDFRLSFSVPIDRFFWKSLTVDQSGRCELVVESNIQQPQTPEIGHYLAQISPKEARELRDRVVSLTEVPLPPQGPFLPGATLYQVSLEEGGKTQVRTFDPYVVPDRYQVVGRQVAKLEEEARKNMAVGLRFDLLLLDKQVDRREATGMTLRITGLGKEPIRFYYPLERSKEGAGRMILQGIRSDIKERDLKFFHRQAHSLARIELQTIRPALGQRDQSILTLMPGGSIEFDFRAILDWPPGPYRVEMIVETSGERKGWDFVVGTVVTLPQPLSITGEVRPEDEGAKEYKPPKL